MGLVMDASGKVMEDTKDTTGSLNGGPEGRLVPEALKRALAEAEITQDQTMCMPSTDDLLEPSAPPPLLPPPDECTLPSGLPSALTPRPNYSSVHGKKLPIADVEASFAARGSASSSGRQPPIADAEASSSDRRRSVSSSGQQRQIADSEASSSDRRRSPSSSGQQRPIADSEASSSDRRRSPSSSGQQRPIADSEASSSDRRRSPSSSGRHGLIADAPTSIEPVRGVSQPGSDRHGLIADAPTSIASHRRGSAVSSASLASTEQGSRSSSERFWSAPEPELGLASDMRSLASSLDQDGLDAEAEASRGFGPPPSASTPGEGLPFADVDASGAFDARSSLSSPGEGSPFADVDASGAFDERSSLSSPGEGLSAEDSGSFEEHPASSTPGEGLPFADVEASGAFDERSASGPGENLPLADVEGALACDELTESGFSTGGGALGVGSEEPEEGPDRTLPEDEDSEAEDFRAIRAHLHARVAAEPQFGAADAEDGKPTPKSGPRENALHTIESFLEPYKSMGNSGLTGAYPISLLAEATSEASRSAKPFPFGDAKPAPNPFDEPIPSKKAKAANLVPEVAAQATDDLSADSEPLIRKGLGGQSVYQRLRAVVSGRPQAVFYFVAAFFATVAAVLIGQWLLTPSANSKSVPPAGLVAYQYRGAGEPLADDIQRGYRLLIRARGHMRSQEFAAAEQKLGDCIELSDLPACHKALAMVLVSRELPAARQHLERYVKTERSRPDVEAARRWLEGR